ncbi:MAG TPA: SDR family NAD(P)-dependent oxidoreductase, partial [Sphingomonas sp.]
MPGSTVRLARDKKLKGQAKMPGGCRDKPGMTNWEIGMARFTGKSIIVTGAGSGIGRASAMLFAAEGGSVIAADKTEAVHDTVEAILKSGGIAKAIQMDAGDEGDVERT